MPTSNEPSPSTRGSADPSRPRRPRHARAILATAAALGLSAGAAVIGANQADATPPNAHLAAAHPAGASAHNAIVQFQEWLYPSTAGSNACTAAAEYSDGRVQNGSLKAEYWDIDENGDATEDLASNPDDACNGYSAANAASVKAHSAQQYMTVSLSDLASEEHLTGSTAKSAAAIATLVNFTEKIGFTGIDIDFENYWGWVGPDQANYYRFLTNLATALHADGLQLQVEGPPDDGTGFNYGTVLADGADQVVMMDYDDEYQKPAGSTCLAFSPFTWSKQLIIGALAQIPAGEHDRFVVGLPSEAYTAPDPCDTDKVVGNLSYADMQGEPGFSTSSATIAARRDPGSGEIRWNSGGTTYDYNDSTALDTKLALVESLGVTHISVWVLGGANAWFSAAGAQGTSSSVDAAASGNTLTGRAAAVTCSACSGGARVGYLGTNSAGTHSALTFNGVRAATAGTYEVLFEYCDGSSTARNAAISVNGGSPVTVSFPPTGGFGTPGTIEVPLNLASGTNSVTVGNPTSAAPDFSEVIVPSAPAAD
ncbi:hypothetical protein KDK95_25105 [Actinospica sp. MGRD01-02]|uniref:CBM6 domain-containing protein n=1 Tax=Actinospica acidithermotolerans TaxID=2828514 RepID=A0A941EL73_9ACTN|nr:glycosyl hydrolase family 18 protein [Actinospica acidithermotolerans]MBR7829609.1 hypothetical protein [Actinospica acidithermotolerans]